MPKLAFYYSAYYLYYNIILLRDYISRVFIIELTYIYSVKVYRRDRYLITLLTRPINKDRARFI
jgi:hypothetical protein